MSGRHDGPPVRPLLVVSAVVLLGTAAIVANWTALAGIGPARLDGRALGEALEVRTGALTASAVALTNLGGTLAMGAVALGVVVVCWLRGRRADAVLAAVAAVGAALLFRGLKQLFARPRPPVADRVVTEVDPSLPSGHATMSIVVVGTLVVLAWAGRGARARLGMVAVAALWVGAVGATRVYLGVHWFSDVLAGWLTGAAWLAVCVAVWAWWRAARAGRAGAACSPP